MGGSFRPLGLGVGGSLSLITGLQCGFRDICQVGVEEEGIRDGEMLREVMLQHRSTVTSLLEMSGSGLMAISTDRPAPRHYARSKRYYPPK